jgi:hypothetical protein
MWQVCLLQMQKDQQKRKLLLQRPLLRLLLLRQHRLQHPPLRQWLLPLPLQQYPYLLPMGKSRLRRLPPVWLQSAALTLAE